ncbi:JmjC domain-containing protein [Streptomyces gilvosporeus]|uniref:JmjC domain-containing protein n=1 Tax=Streptomyces gilvosporeus TaxID=553510 RepID=UPI000D1AEC5E|nr:cupin domain-containing protein [Streptomyces gilvosporeus]
MSLRLLLPDNGVTDLLLTWPDEPHVYERGKTALDGAVTAAGLKEWLFTGCAPVAEVAAVKAPRPSVNPKLYTNTYGRTNGAKLKELYADGYTLRLGNLQRVMPFMAQVSTQIQEETGYSNYIHAFLTPGGRQGLRHHWDQQMAVIVQLSGVKVWQMWKPPVKAPMREYNESFRVWRDDYVPGWEGAGPDQEIVLKPGQSMLLPRGWVHNPLVADPDEPSVHLTFAIRERTPMWLAEKLLAGAIEDPAFRQVVRPGQLTGASLVQQLLDVRGELINYLNRLSIPTVAEQVHDASLTELEYNT